MAPVGLTKDAGWEIGVSRTLRHPPEHVWDFLTGPGLATWLGRGAALGDKGTAVRTPEGTGEVRSVRPGDRVRLAWQPQGWDHESTVQVAVRPARGGAGTMVRFHQERLADAAERERQRAHWSSVLDRVESALG